MALRGLFLGIILLFVILNNMTWASGPKVLKNPYGGINWETVQQYKANFHSHTIKSDGRAEPDELIYMFADAGYDILAIADHDVTYTVREGERDPGPTHETTWPWTRWIDEEPSKIWTYEGMESSAFYPDLGSRGMLAVRANELSQTPHLLSIFNDCGYTNRNQTDHQRMTCILEKNGFAFWAHPTYYMPGGSWEDRFFEYDESLILLAPTEGSIASNPPFFEWEEPPSPWDEAVTYFANYIVGYETTLGIEFTPRALDRELDVSMKLLDSMLEKHYREDDIFIVGNDDTHQTYVADNALHTIILAEELTEEAIKDALRQGQTIVARRVSTTPHIKRIEVNEQQERIEVEIENSYFFKWYVNGKLHSGGNSLDYSNLTDAIVRFTFHSDEERFFSQAFYIGIPDEE